MKNDEAEAVRSWKIGKELGFSFNGEDDIVISKLICVEKRDNNKQRCNRTKCNVSNDENC